MASSGATLGKPLPRNDVAERAVLGAILIDNSKLEVVLKGVADFRSGDFFSVEFRLIFTHMLALKDAGKGIDLLTVAEELSRAKQMNLQEACAICSSLIDGVPQISNVVDYARIVKEKSCARQLVRIAENIQEKSWDERDDIGKMAEQLRVALKHLSGNGNGNGNGNGHRKDAYSGIEFMVTDFPRPKHIIEPILPEHGTALLVAMPHRLKSWFTTGLALACTKAGKALGYLDVPDALNPMLIQIEDYEGYVKDRMQSLLLNPQFQDCDPARVRLIGREQFSGGFTAEWMQWLEGQIVKFKTDFIILDVLRRFFVGHGDINSPGDMADFLEKIDLIRDHTGVSVMLVHHENRKAAELMNASSGSGYLPSWANVVMQLKRKTEAGDMTMVEFEADGKFLPNSGQMRMILQLNNPTVALRFEDIGEGDDWREFKAQLGPEWTIQNLAEVADVHRTSALRRLKVWEKKGIAEKVESSKRGMRGGHAIYRFLEPGE